MTDHSDIEEIEEFDEYLTGSDDDEDPDIEGVDIKKSDIEYFEYTCLKQEEVGKLLQETSENLCGTLDITSSLAKLLLQSHGWNVQLAISNYDKDSHNLLIKDKINSKTIIATSTKGNANIDTLGNSSAEQTCSICVTLLSKDDFVSLSCTHIFCKTCWTTYIEMKISEGASSIICMESGCEIPASEDLVLKYLTQHSLKLRYHKNILQISVMTHPELRFCPGADCGVIFQSKYLKARRCICCDCKTVFCFKCGMEYHAPMNCQTFQKWLSTSDLEGASLKYVYVNTKNCPTCEFPIEKNGGCNHIVCFKCKANFCWQCLGHWGYHTGTSVYKCAHYKEDESITNRKAEEKQLLSRLHHYMGRFENHSKSLEFEIEACDKLAKRIEEKTLLGHGSWINWQYLYPATKVLTKCRNTLKWTYPKAFYMEAGPERNIFEFQQGRLEVEIETLSWKIEQADFKDRADIQKQVSVCEQCRITLLQQFLEN